MKKLTLLAALVTVATTLAMASPKKPTCVSVLSTKRDIFYFKVTKEFIGATVKVYSAAGEKIFEEKVTHRKAIIDFYLENPGQYSIKLEKDTTEQWFSYKKTKPSPLVPANIEVVEPGIIISQ